MSALRKPGFPHAVQARTPANLDIHFVVKKLHEQWPDIMLLDDRDIASQAHRFRGGINNWVVQSYLQLKEPLARAGIRARIREDFVAGAICIAHSDHLNCFSDFCEKSYIVAVRADRPPVQIGRRHIVQNLLDGRDECDRYLPLWSQPGLIPRDGRRGDRIERIAYFGRDESMPHWLREPSFAAALHRRGVTFTLRTHEWNHCSDADLVLAQRIASPTLLHEEPASKLINAWLAGVPALLSDEPAYAALRRSGLNYLAVDTPQSVLRAIDYLRSKPAAYSAMVENGLHRARDYGADAVRARWLEFILTDAIPDFLRGRSALPPLLRFPAFVARLVRQKLAAKRFRRKMAFELRSLRSAERPHGALEDAFRDSEVTRTVPYSHIAA